MTPPTPERKKEKEGNRVQKEGKQGRSMICGGRGRGRREKKVVRVQKEGKKEILGGEKKVS